MIYFKFSILSLLLLIPAVGASYEPGSLRRLRKDTGFLKGVRGAKRDLVEGNETIAEILANSTAAPVLAVTRDEQQFLEEGGGDKGAAKKGSDKQAVAGTNAGKGAAKKGSDKQAVAGTNAGKGATKKGSDKQAVAGTHAGKGDTKKGSGKQAVADTNAGKGNGLGKVKGKVKNDKQGVSDDGGAPKASKGEPKAARDTEPKKGADKSMEDVQSVGKGDTKAAKQSKENKGAGKRDSEPKKGAGKSMDDAQSIAKGKTKAVKDSNDGKGAGKRDSEPKKGAGKSMDDAQTIAKSEPKAAKDSNDGKGAGKRTGDLKSAAKGAGKPKDKSIEVEGDVFAFQTLGPTEGNLDELAMDEDKGAGKNKGEAKAAAAKGEGKTSREEVVEPEDEAAESTEELQEESIGTTKAGSKKEAKGVTGASRRIRGRH